MKEFWTSIQLIFALVGIAHVEDVYVIGDSSVLRTAVIFFYLSNEGVSLLENATHLGLPIPEKLKDDPIEIHPIMCYESHTIFASVMKLPIEYRISTSS